MSEQGAVPVSDAGFRHGVGVFETVRVQNGKAPWQDWHLESIRESAKALGLKIDESNLEKIPAEHGIWRWFVTETGTRTWWSNNYGVYVLDKHLLNSGIYFVKAFTKNGVAIKKVFID